MVRIVYNPFTDNLDYEGGNNGTIITAVNGQSSLTAPTITVTTNTGVATVENRAWATQYVVDPSSTPGLRGTFTTIQSAINQAVTDGVQADIYIRPGVYTENITMAANVNLVSYVGNENNGTVTISGNITATFAGSASISGIRLQTNAANLLTVSGSSATIINLLNCDINCTNNTGISFTSSSSSASIQMYNCTGNLATTGITFFVSTSAGNIEIHDSYLLNTGGSTTASSTSTGNILFRGSQIRCPISVTGGAALFATHSVFETNNTNVTTLTVTNGQISNCYIASGTASAISVSATGLFGLTGCSVFTSNTTAISGAGTLQYSNICFGIAGLNQITTTTRTALNQGTFLPTITGETSAGTTVYTTQAGFYTRNDNIVSIKGKISLSSATGTGNAVLGGFPYGIANITNYDPIGSVLISSSTWTWPTATTSPVMTGIINTATSRIGVFGSGQGGFLQMNNSAATFNFWMTYRIF